VGGQRRGSSKTVSVNVDHYKGIVNELLDTKLGGDQFDLNSLSDVARKTLANLADAPQGRKAEDELIRNLMGRYVPTSKKAGMNWKRAAWYTGWARKSES
jgi:hypothetical protein